MRNFRCPRDSQNLVSFWEHGPQAISSSSRLLIELSRSRLFNLLVPSCLVQETSAVCGKREYRRPLLVFFVWWIELCPSGLHRSVDLELISLNPSHVDRNLFGFSSLTLLWVPVDYEFRQLTHSKGELAHSQAAQEL